jgi:hypothetical protein
MKNFQKLPNMGMGISGDIEESVKNIFYIFLLHSVRNEMLKGLKNSFPSFV